MRGGEWMERGRAQAKCELLAEVVINIRDAPTTRRQREGINQHRRDGQRQSLGYQEGQERLPARGLGKNGRRR